MDIVKVFKDKAEELGYGFSYGTRQFLNYETTLKNMREDKYQVLMLPPSETDEYNQKVYKSGTRYTVTFQLASKFENLTNAKLDETYYQKHERRLDALLLLCRAFVAAIICENDISPQTARYAPEINLYATLVDVYNCEFSFIDYGD
jgi:hypothetical protein